jgi:hypothetical protein
MIRNTDFFPKRRAIRAKAGPNEIGELNDGLDVPKSGIVHALEIFVAILEDLDVVCVWDFEGHD